MVGLVLLAAAVWLVTLPWAMWMDWHRVLR